MIAQIYNCMQKNAATIEIFKPQVKRLLAGCWSRFSLQDAAQT